jgi:cytochrome c2/mono/diheme cytochrome c family protein
MKKVFKVLLIIVLIIIVFVGIMATYINFRGMPKYTAQKIDIKVAATPARIEKGQKLASMLCKTCHYNEQTRKFTGKELVEAPQFGTLYSANITHDSIAGIGNWTDGELIYFIRTGIHPKRNEYVPPYMPKLIHISDEDLYSIIAFLRSDNDWVKADNTRHPATKPSFLTKFLLTIGAFKPFDYPKQPIAGPDTTNQLAVGKYIALYQLECFSCHSRDFAKNDYLNPEKSPGFFAGGNKLKNAEGQDLVSLNITMDEETGIGRWTEDMFVKAVRTGILPDGSPALRYPMIPYSNLSEQEVKAIYAYLKTVPKINNKVERKLD